MRRPTSRQAFLIVSIVGLVLMLGFDTTITRIVGVACIFGALALGVAVIATPEFLSADQDEEAEDPPA